MHTRKQTFELAVLPVLRQGKSSAANEQTWTFGKPGTATRHTWYRTESAPYGSTDVLTYRKLDRDLACPIGYVMTSYHASMEQYPVDHPRVAFTVIEHEMDLLLAIQRAHDETAFELNFVAAFKSRCALVADRFGITLKTATP